MEGSVGRNWKEWGWGNSSQNIMYEKIYFSIKNNDNEDSKH